MSFDRQQLYQQFGKHALEAGLFSHYRPSLRFDLGWNKPQYRSHLEVFIYALDKARLLLGPVASAADSFYACFSQEDAITAQWGGAEQYLSEVLRENSLELLGPTVLWRQEYIECEVERGFRAYLLCEIPGQQLNSVLWLALAKEMGVYPQFQGDIRLFWPQQGIVVNAYDDRGMDIAGPNHDLLHWLYRSFAQHLNCEAREQMDSDFQFE